MIICTDIPTFIYKPSVILLTWPHFGIYMQSTESDICNDDIIIMILMIFVALPVIMAMCNIWPEILLCGQKKLLYLFNNNIIFISTLSSEILIS